MKYKVQSSKFEECMCMDSTRSRFRTSNFELRTFLTLAALMFFRAATSSWAVDETAKPPTSAPKAVREGNLLLKAGDAASALDRYRQAETLQPNAREIAFDRGLGHYALGEFDKAREAFEQAARGEADALADDAMYSAGASDHAEGLAQAADPKLALSKLESAMQRYQSVLSRHPEHHAARDANYKAATTWRQLKQQLEKQKQQQNSDQENQNKEEEQENQEQQPSQQQNEDKPQEQQSAQNQEQQSQEQKSEQQQSSSAEEQEKKEEQAKETQAQQQEEKEQVSREQAERKLREMMQALRDRRKLKPEEVRKVPIAPVDKDW